tara:strand:+ start:920 stop:1075 length:156 start_codon:yes stop_codon:yes gene_type:complete
LEKKSENYVDETEKRLLIKTIASESYHEGFLSVNSPKGQFITPINYPRLRL